MDHKLCNDVLHLQTLRDELRYLSRQLLGYVPEPSDEIPQSQNGLLRSRLAYALYLAGAPVSRKKESGEPI